MQKKQDQKAAKASKYRIFAPGLIQAQQGPIQNTFTRWVTVRWDLCHGCKFTNEFEWLTWHTLLFLSPVHECAKDSWVMSNLLVCAHYCFEAILIILSVTCNGDRSFPGLYRQMKTYQNKMSSGQRTQNQTISIICSHTTPFLTKAFVFLQKTDSAESRV